MDYLFELMKSLLEPNWIVSNGGLFLITLIVFIETGIIIGFFLPGDPLLFVAGILIASVTECFFPFDNTFYNLIFWISFISLAGIIGNFTAYFIGNKFGHLLLGKRDSWLFKKKHLNSAHEFYNKRGGLAIVLARFLPIVRAFAPVIAGIVKMDKMKFLFYNIFGAILWVGGITTLGYIFGDNVWVKKNLEYVIIGIVVLSTSPVLYKLIFNNKGNIVSN